MQNKYTVGYNSDYFGNTRYVSISYMDGKLKNLEAKADKAGYNIENNKSYLKLCEALTEREIDEGRKTIPYGYARELYVDAKWQIYKFIHKI